MRRFWSWTGSALALLYAGAFGYVGYLRHAGDWLAEFYLAFLALPFTLPMSWLTGGSFDFTGDRTARVVAAALFCCALVYLAGLIVGSLLSLAFRLIVRR